MDRIRICLFCALLTCGSLLVSGVAKSETKPVTIGSKAFTEGYLLGELLAQKIEPHDPVVRRFGMGGTGILFQSLMSGEIQLYTEYTGTISEEILKKPRLADYASLQIGLANIGLVMSAPLGFNNTYALAVTSAFAEHFQLKTLSDFAKVSNQARAAFSHEFVERSDGLKALSKKYDFHLADNLQALEHSLAYEAIRQGQADVIDVYSTDAKIEKFHLVVLMDDRDFFPRYEAVVLARKDFTDTHPDLWREIESLHGTINAESMRKLNAQVDVDKKSFHEVIANYLNPDQRAQKFSGRAQAFRELSRRTKEHLFLVCFALLFSILIGVPLGLLATRNRYLGQVILLFSGLIQTIPSLALLCFLIPLFGIGRNSALVALCLYGLLPIVMNTFTGLRSIDPNLIEMSQALRLSFWQSMFRIQLPLASRSILAGVRTSAVITIGTATLAALIGAGGYGATIVSGLAVNDTNLILMGAIPAAAMALTAHVLFEGVGFWVVPKGLR